MAEQRKLRLKTQNEFMEILKRVAKVKDENDLLKERLARRELVLERLTGLSLACSSLISSSSRSSLDNYPSSIVCLANVSGSSALSDPDYEDEAGKEKLIVGKFLNQAISILSGFSSITPSKISIAYMAEIEHKICQLLILGEKNHILPNTEPNAGWKRELFRNNQLLEAAQPPASSISNPHL